MFKNKKTTTFTITSLIILGFIILFGYYKVNKLEEDIELNKYIVKIVNNSEQVNFQEITDFDWDNIYIFTPYLDPINIFKEDNIKNYNISFNIKHLDTINMIAFVNQNKLVKFVEINRSDFEFEHIENYKVSKNDAIFSVIVDDGTKLVLKE